MKNSNGELSVNAQQSDPDVAAKHASSETRVSKESVGWDQLFYEGTSADELVDVLDRPGANSIGAILKEWAIR
ncbi:hypothetical protein [Rhizobium leguminosarum]|uniref:hypothetical protein n=1 Tax=Rhizobium leguminosarum TaxID=384 RepID=UPI001C9374B5|nr:hypothetical protein [Rhizobium leguminosarum]MBY5640043.1 hypothetical protein [Rhizobium leguminosarum]MBY5665499.1 hypothetical protein [Rhizobium leguminosarum]MBY5678671.1 hypothetical protein [Rhizobium leguminosarum]MBY5703888.1 hypothetical protein [Rhizobium leguminosarum]